MPKTRKILKILSEMFKTTCQASSICSEIVIYGFMGALNRVVHRLVSLGVHVCPSGCMVIPWCAWACLVVSLDIPRGTYLSLCICAYPLDACHPLVCIDVLVSLVIPLLATPVPLVRTAEGFFYSICHLFLLCRSNLTYKISTVYIVTHLYG